MVSKSMSSIAAMFLPVVVSDGELGYADAAVPLRRALVLGWMNGTKGGSSPGGGMQPSGTFSKLFSNGL
jgi:hypothetical protein